MTWSKGRQLSSLSSDSTETTYTYDMDGIRNGKNCDGWNYEYITQSGLVVRETSPHGTLDFIYDSQQRPYALIHTSSTAQTVYYYVLNLQGDVMALLDSTGAVVAKYEYNAWGEILSVTDGEGAAVLSNSHIANLNPLRYRGYYYDNESGFYYLQSRYYDPSIGRFINADAAEYSQMSALNLCDTNLFAYCRNNPTSYEDNGGNFVATAAIAGGIAGAIISGFSYVASHQDSFNGWAFAFAVVGGGISGAAAGVLNFPAAAATTVVTNLVIGTIEGGDPGMTLVNALISGAGSYFGGIFGDKLAKSIWIAGDAIGGFLGSSAAGIFAEFGAQSVQTVANIGYSTSGKTSTAAKGGKTSIANKTSANKSTGGLSSDFRGLDYWHKYYGANWSRYYN